MFAEADCQVRPNGLWGPAAAQISPHLTKANIRARTAAEAGIRADYRELMRLNHDPEAERALVSAQAEFSSAREDLCRDYDQEEEHGFCSTRYTQARHLALSLRLDAARKTEKPRRSRIKPAAAAEN